MIKRGFSVFLAAVMVLSFSACGPKRESRDRLQSMHWLL